MGRVGRFVAGTALVVGGVLVGGLSFGTASAISAAMIGSGASMALGALLQRKGLSNRQANALSNPISSTASLPVIYGTSKVGITIVDLRNDASDDDILWVVGALCVGSEGGGGIDNVTAIYFDDRLAVTTPNITGTLTSDSVGADWNDADGNPLVSYAVHLGTDAQTVDTALTAAFPTEWPSTSKGAGIAYIVFKLTHDKSVFASGLPTISAVVKGQKVFDPRDSSTAWSTNPALAIQDYIESSKYGLDIARTDIDTTAISDAANYADETVNTTAYNSTRFTCNGILDTAQQRPAALGDLLTSCRGELVYQSGAFRLFIRQPTAASAFTLTEDNIVGDWEFVRAGSSVPNSVTVGFIDPTLQYQVREVTWPEAGQVNGFLSADNDIPNAISVELPFTTNYYIAQQIGMVSLREAREDVTIAVTAKEEALKLQVGDVVSLTHSTPGFTAKDFWVASVGILPDATCRLLLREYSVDAYTLDTQNTEASVPGSDLPDPFAVVAPTGLTLTSDSSTALETQDGGFVPRIAVSWTAAATPFVARYEVQYKVTADATWTHWGYTPRDITATYIAPVTDLVGYSVQVRAENTIGAESAWVSGTVTVATQPSDESTRTSVIVEELSRTDSTITYGLTWGSAVDSVWFYSNQYTQAGIPAAGPWPTDSTEPTEILVNDDASHTVDIPPPGYVNYVQFEPRTDTLAAGPVVRLPITPTLEPPDRIISVEAAVNDEDGSVAVQVYAADRTDSYRYAYNVGADPTWPADADVEAGTVRTITGADSFTLAADTVALDQIIRIRFAPYTAATGVGTDGATDHGEIVGTFDLRLKAPVELDVTTTTESGTTGTFGVTVIDPTGIADDLYYRTKSGTSAFSAWTLKTATPTHNTEYQQTVTLVEKHGSQIEFRLDYTFNGQSMSIVQNSGTFDLGKIPDGVIVPHFNENTDAASLDLIGDFDTASWKVAASVAGMPSDATVRAATATNGRVQSDVAVISGLVIGQRVYFKAFAYSAVDGGGNESSASFQAEAVYKVSAPLLHGTTATESSSIGTFGVTVEDPGGQADDLYYRTKSGTGAYGSWTLKTASPADNTEYTETVALVEKHVSHIQFRLDYTLGNAAQSFTIESPAFDPGKIPDGSIIPFVDEDGIVGATFDGDFDTASWKFAASASGTPSDATVRAATAQDGRIVTDNLITLASGETAFIAAYAYSAASGGGTESSTKLTAKIGYQRTALPAQFTSFKLAVEDNGTNIVYTSTWGLTDTVNDTDHSVVVEYYEGATLVSTKTNAPSDLTDTFTDVGAGDGIDNTTHFAIAYLEDKATPPAVLDSRETRLRAATI